MLDVLQPGADVLADVMDSLRVKGRVYCRSEFSAPWAIGFGGEALGHFHLIEDGSCWLRLDGQRDPIPLQQGDLLVIVPRGRSYQLCDDLRTPTIPLADLIGSSHGGLRALLRHGGGGPATNVICGAFEFLGAHSQSVLGVLPEWIRVPKDDRSDNEWLNATLRFLQREMREPSVGSEMIVARLIDVMFVEAIRAWLKSQPEGRAGWLGALRDPSIGTALGLIHKNPEKAWTVSLLAAQVGMSRSPFAARFTSLVGQSPMSYLKQWRLQLAAKLLQDQALSLSQIAEQVGYESTAAFSRIFKREFGAAPGQFRRKALVGRPAGVGAEADHSTAKTFAPETGEEAGLTARN